MKMCRIVVRCNACGGVCLRRNAVCGVTCLVVRSWMHNERVLPWKPGGVVFGQLSNPCGSVECQLSGGFLPRTTRNLRHVQSTHTHTHTSRKCNCSSSRHNRDPVTVLVELAETTSCETQSVTIGPPVTQHLVGGMFLYTSCFGHHSQSVASASRRPGKRKLRQKKREKKGGRERQKRRDGRRTRRDGPGERDKGRRTTGDQRGKGTRGRRGTSRVETRGGGKRERDERRDQEKGKETGWREKRETDGSGETRKKREGSDTEREADGSGDEGKKSRRK